MNLYFNHHYYYKNEIRYCIRIAPLFFMGTGGGPLAKPMENRKKGRGNGKGIMRHTNAPA